MKNIIPVLLLIILFSLACEENEYYIAPAAEFEISTEEGQNVVTVGLFDRVYFTNKGEGQFFSVYTGDPGHEYSEEGTGGVGFKTDAKGNFNYSYSDPGTFEVVYIATSYKDGEIVEAVSKKAIEVVENDENVSGISSLTFLNENYPGGNYLGIEKDYYNKFIQEGRIDGSNISIEVYQPFRLYDINFMKILSDKEDIEIRPRIDLVSQTATVEIEGIGTFTNYTQVTHTDESGNFIPITYTVVSNTGDRTDYLVNVMCIPEFSDFSIDGVSGLVKINKYDYNRFTISLKLPAETDLSQLQPEFTCFDSNDTKAYIDGTEQTGSSQTVDFSQGAVNYELVFAQPDYEDVFQSKSTITVNVTK